MTRFFDRPHSIITKCKYVIPLKRPSIPDLQKIGKVVVERKVRVFVFISRGRIAGEPFVMSKDGKSLTY
jgi:hypothetical protein